MTILTEYNIDEQRHILTNIPCSCGPDHQIHIIISDVGTVTVKHISADDVLTFIEKQRLRDIIEQVKPLLAALENWNTGSGCKYCFAVHPFIDDPALTSHKPECPHFQAYHINQLIQEL